MIVVLTIFRDDTTFITLLSVFIRTSKIQQLGLFLIFSPVLIKLFS